MRKACSFFSGHANCKAETTVLGAHYLPCCVAIRTESDLAPARNQVLASLERTLTTPLQGVFPSVEEHALSPSRCSIAPMKLVCVFLLSQAGLEGSIRAVNHSNTDHRLFQIVQLEAGGKLPAITSCVLLCAEEIIMWPLRKIFFVSGKFDPPVLIYLIFFVQYSLYPNINAILEFGCED